MGGDPTLPCPQTFPLTLTHKPWPLDPLFMETPPCGGGPLGIRVLSPTAQLTLLFPPVLPLRSIGVITYIL